MSAAPEGRSSKTVTTAVPASSATRTSTSSIETLGVRVAEGVAVASAAELSLGVELFTARTSNVCGPSASPVTGCVKVSPTDSQAVAGGTASPAAWRTS